MTEALPTTPVNIEDTLHAAGFMLLSALGSADFSAYPSDIATGFERIWAGPKDSSIVLSVDELNDRTRDMFASVDAYFQPASLAHNKTFTPGYCRIDKSIGRRLFEGTVEFDELQVVSEMLKLAVEDVKNQSNLFSSTTESIRYKTEIAYFASHELYSNQKGVRINSAVKVPRKLRNKLAGK
jgi:hypothetical protein